MKCHKFWVQEKRTIQIKGEAREIKLLVGSDLSKDDAASKANLAAQAIQERISNNAAKDEYESEIKEFVSKTIDDDNIVTVNRYGAFVLNSSRYTILDLDDYPFEFLDLFRSFKGMTKKDRIVQRFEQRLTKCPELGNSFRIYETCKGVRVICNTYLDPHGERFMKIMRHLNVDWLYATMSQKQDCYRARLTPKPYRMRIKTIRIKTPLDCETASYRDWVSEYLKHSMEYSVVKLRKVIGPDFSNDPAIRSHDEITNMQKSGKLV